MEQTLIVFNKLDADLLTLAKKTIDRYEQDETVTLYEVGRGTCGTVYALGDNHVLKINDDWNYDPLENIDFAAMKDLQGQPFVPTLYASRQTINI